MTDAAYCCLQLANIIGPLDGMQSQNQNIQVQILKQSSKAALAEAILTPSCP